MEPIAVTVRGERRWMLTPTSPTAQRPARDRPGSCAGQSRPGVCQLLPGCEVWERAGDGGGAAGHVQPGVDVLKVDAHGSLRHAEPPGDLGVGVPGGDQVQQFPLPGRQLGDWVTASFGVEVCLVQVGAQQCQQRAVTLGKVRTGVLGGRRQRPSPAPPAHAPKAMP